MTISRSFRAWISSRRSDFPSRRPRRHSPGSQQATGSLTFGLSDGGTDCWSDATPCWTDTCSLNESTGGSGTISDSLDGPGSGSGSYSIAGVCSGSGDLLTVSSMTTSAAHSSEGVSVLEGLQVGASPANDLFAKAYVDLGDGPYAFGGPYASPSVGAIGTSVFDGSTLFEYDDGGGYWTPFAPTSYVDLYGGAGPSGAVDDTTYGWRLQAGENLDNGEAAPDTDTSTVNGNPNQEASKLFYFDENIGSTDGVARASRPSLSACAGRPRRRAQPRRHHDPNPGRKRRNGYRRRRRRHRERFGRVNGRGWRDDRFLDGDHWHFHLGAARQRRFRGRLCRAGG